MGDDGIDGQGGWLDDYEPDDFETRRGGRKKRKADPGYELGHVEVIRETDKALLVRGEGLSSDPFGLKDPNEEGWIPKSQILGTSELQADCGVGAKGKLTISTWLAEKRGLV